MARRGRAADDEVERRIDALLAADPKGFVAARDALARERAAAGDPRARDVKALRRPTVLAAALNRLAMDRGTDLATLVETGARLRAAHAAALRGEGGAALREADAEVSRALEVLVAEARRTLVGEGHGASPAALLRLRAALRSAAAAGGDRAEALLRGRFAREPESATDDAFAALAASGAVSVPATGSRDARAPSGGRARGREGAAADQPPHPKAGPGPGSRSTSKGELRALQAAEAARRRAEREESRLAAAEQLRAERERAALAKSLARAEAEARRMERAVEVAERRAAAAGAALEAARSDLAAARHRVDMMRRSAAAVPRLADARPATAKR